MFLIIIVSRVTSALLRMGWAARCGLYLALGPSSPATTQGAPASASSASCAVRGHYMPQDVCVLFLVSFNSFRKPILGFSFRMSFLRFYCTGKQRLPINIDLKMKELYVLKMVNICTCDPRLSLF